LLSRTQSASARAARWGFSGVAVTREQGFVGVDGVEFVYEVDAPVDDAAADRRERVVAVDARDPPPVDARAQAPLGGGAGDVDALGDAP